MPPTPNTEGAITETPASQVSSADFDSSDPQLPSFEDILARSPIAKMLGLHDNPVGEEPEEQKKPAAKKAPPVKEPEEEVVAETPAGDEDVDNEEIDEESVEAAAETEEGESGAEEEDDIDWEYKIPVEIDGKTEKRTLGEVRAAFAAKEVLKAREAELTALKASAEAAYAEKLKNVEHLGTLLFKELLTEENLLADEYRKVVANIAKARESKDTFALTELKDQKESIQEKHAVLKSKREASARAIATELKKAADSRQEALLAKFQADIPTTLPGFNEKLAAQIRSFAIQEGIPEGRSCQGQACCTCSAAESKCRSSGQGAIW